MHIPGYGRISTGRRTRKLSKAQIKTFSMQKLLILTAFFCLNLIQAKDSQAQQVATNSGAFKSNSFTPQDSASHPIKADTSVVELSPVPLSANIDANNPYERLKPVATGLPDNFISGNFNDYVINFTKNYYQDYNKDLISMQSKGEPYFNLISKVFNRFGIPEELKYLAVIESGLNTHARSRAGAVGTWQLMAGTARLLGLQVNRNQDDRVNLYKSTIAAAKYLNKLYDTFDNWLLVVAAYNCGPGGVLSAINESGSTDFWELKKYLPAESQQHVMKFLATAYILDRFANFFGVDKSNLLGDNFEPVKDDFRPSTPQNLAVIHISGKYSLPVIAKYTSMNINELNSLNPGFDKMMGSSANSFDLRLPADKMIVFKEKKNAILTESVQLLMENNRQMAENTFPAAKNLPAAKNKPHKG